MSKRFLISFVTMSLFFSQASFAGFKEANGDDSLVFKCQNAAGITLLGYQSLYIGLIELLVYSGDQMVASDMGMLESSVFDGDSITISFEGDKGTVKSTRKVLKYSAAEYGCVFNDVK